MENQDSNCSETIGPNFPDTSNLNCSNIIMCNSDHINNSVPDLNCSITIEYNFSDTPTFNQLLDLLPDTLSRMILSPFKTSD